MRWPALWKLLLLLLGGYGLLCLVVMAFQRSLMYFPSRMGELDALQAARNLGLEPWRDRSGTLLGWRTPGRVRPRRVLVLPGNAGSALDRGYYLPLLGSETTEVILFEYPGFGARPGVPSRAELDDAAAQAVAQLRKEAQGPLWLLGESLGSGVACAVAAARPEDIAGLVLVTPFARMAEVAAWHYPYLPVRLLLRDRWDNVAALARYPGPVGLFIAGQDEVVGAEQGRRLAATLAGRARLWEQPAAGHNSFSTGAMTRPWPEVRDFLEAPAVAGK